MKVLVLVLLAACGQVKSDPQEVPDAPIDAPVDAPPDALVCTGDDVVCEGACVTPASFDGDAAHCGRCGHSCLGGTCTAGVCEAVALATDQRVPSGVVADENFVYWSIAGDAGGGGAILRAPLSGGAPEVLAANQNGAGGLQRDATHLYWARPIDGMLVRMPLAGGTPTPIVVGGRPGTFVVDPSGVYFGDDAARTISRVSHAGGTPTVLVTDQRAQCQMAVFGTDLYMSVVPATGAPRLMRAPLGGGVPSTVLVGIGNACSVAMNANRLFVTNLQSSGTVTSANHDGSDAAAIATQRPGPASIALDADAVYWTENGTGSAPSAVMRRPLTGGDATVVTSFSRSTVGLPVALFVDDKSVYLSVANEAAPTKGQVLRVAKP
jgi:hypothetical protein